MSFAQLSSRSHSRKREDSISIEIKQDQKIQNKMSLILGRNEGKRQIRGIVTN